MIYPSLHRKCITQKLIWFVGGSGGGTTEVTLYEHVGLTQVLLKHPDELDASGTGIGIGANTASQGGADIITFVTSGNVEAKITTTGGIESDDIRSMTTDTNPNIPSKWCRYSLCK